MKRLLTVLLLVIAFSNIARAGEIDIGGFVGSAPSGFAWFFNGIWSLLSI